MKTNSKIILLIATFSFLAITACQQKQQEATNLPNIIYILADDLGYGELGCYGQQKIETPNIDKLATTGMRFTQHYSGSAVCAPARCNLLTGVHPGHAFIRGNHEWGSRGDVWSYEAMINDSTLEGQYPLPDSTITIANLLQDAGYVTGMAGKWGLGAPHTNSIPNKMGFDFFIGYNCQRIAHTYYPVHLYKNENRLYLNNDTVKPHLGLEEGADPYDITSYSKFNLNDYAPDVMQKEVLSFIDENKDKPFFMYYASPIPHLPLQAPQEWVDYYVEKFGDEDPLEKAGYYPHRYPRAAYAAMISYLDEQIGELVSKLKELGIYENTIIIFTSDNGPTYLDADTKWFESARPFQTETGRTKGHLYEGGIRVPMIVSWPDKIKAGTETKHISAFWDVMPTFCDIAGTAAPVFTDGISFLPVLSGEEQEKHEYLYWEFAGYGGQQAVRMGPWKAIRKDIRKGNLEIELYNLDIDIKEENNVAAANPEIVKKMEEIMRKEHTPSTIERFKMEALGEQYSVLDITDFGIKPGTGENAIYAVQEAIEKAKSIDGGVLIKFPVGSYDFRTDSSHVKTYFESNTTDNNPKNLAFLIEKCQNLIIDGGGSDFVFHGPMQPFSIDNSKNITIQNVNIDWDIPLTAQAEVVSATNEIIELKIDTNQFPYIIDDRWLYFIDKTWKEPMWKWGTMEFDVATRLVVSETGDKGCIRAVDNKFYFEEQKPGIVQILGEFTHVPTVGNFLVLRHSPRDHAGIFVWHSENIHLENINVYHAAGLGCLSQYSRDLNYVNVNFIPNQKKDRFLSAHDDGFQISNCAGQVNIIDCEFAGLMDDPINVHGTSVRIIEILDEHKLKCLFVHKQSEGMLWGRPGEKVAFLENESMQTVSAGRLKSFNAINTSEFIVEFENAVPKEITAGDALENLYWTPKLYISNCLFGSCRARGLLVTTPGKVVIENNIFESSGSAILIAGDANYWYESGAVNDVIIRNNTFNDPCLTSMYQFCEAIISIYPEIPKLNNETPFHRNIVIENNVFYPFDYPVLYAKSVDNIDFINNKIIRSKRFKAFHKRKYTLSFEACKDVEVLGNKFEGDVLGKNILLENMPENEISAQKEFQLLTGS